MMNAKHVVRDGRTFVVSSKSNTNNTCVGVAVGHDHTALLDTKNPQGSVLGVSGSAWSSFVVSAKAGLFE